MKYKRKTKNDKFLGENKPKGTNMEERQFESHDHTEFGHWKGDTIVGSKNKSNSGAVFTLVERKTRFRITIKLKDKKQKLSIKQ